MKKFINWLKQGKSRGILVILLFSLLLSISSYFSAHSTARADLKELTSIPEMPTFLQEFPELPIKNGKIQGDIVWSRLIPGFNIPVIVDSTSTKVAPEAQPGIYVTNSQVVFQGDGEQKSYDFWKYEILFSLPLMLNCMVNYTIPGLAAISIFLFCMVFFLFTAALSLVIARIARIPYDNGRLWRTSMVGSLITLALSFILSIAYGLNLGVLSLQIGLAFLSLFMEGSHASINILPLCVATIISVLLLYWIKRKNKEI